VKFLVRIKSRTRSNQSLFSHVEELLRLVLTLGVFARKIIRSVLFLLVWLSLNSMFFGSFSSYYTIRVALKFLRYWGKNLPEKTQILENLVHLYCIQDHRNATLHDSVSVFGNGRSWDGILRFRWSFFIT
jgi:hypothetical protein